MHLWKLYAGRVLQMICEVLAWPCLIAECLFPSSYRTCGDKSTSEQYASKIALDITHSYLCNTSLIILSDNGGGVGDIKTTWLLDVIDHSLQPNTSSYSLVQSNYLWVAGRCGNQGLLHRPPGNGCTTTEKDCTYTRFCMHRVFGLICW